MQESFATSFNPHMVGTRVLLKWPTPADLGLIPIPGSDDLMHTSDDLMHFNLMISYLGIEITN